MNIRKLQREAHRIAVEHGWWEEPRTFAHCICLVHCELSEAVEAQRDSSPPANVALELADAVIRIFDLAEYYGLNMEQAIIWKNNYNETRPYRHGKRF